MRRAREQVESKKRDDDSLAPFLRSTTKKTGQHRQQSDKGVAQPTTWSGFVPFVKRAFVRWVRHLPAQDYDMGIAFILRAKRSLVLRRHEPGNLSTS